MRNGKVEIPGIDTATLEVLTEEEKHDLLLRARAGDAEARERLVLGNLRLVLSVIGRFRPKGESADDLFQVGCVGLIKAIDRFNVSLDVCFSTYAVPTIKGLRNFLAKQGVKVIYGKHYQHGSAAHKERSHL